jgi:23S rRNA pseudouridine1911/1915/1917 synthase
MKKRVEQAFQVVFEDNHLIIVNKRPGILVQGDSTGDKTLSDYVKDYIKVKYNKPGDVFLGTVHRLDRPVSGLVIFARTSKALERMNEMFKSRKIQKTYWAVVKRKPAEEKGRLVDFLLKNEEKNTVSAFDDEVPGSQRAELSYQYLGEINKHYLLEVNPITGRSHQIRVQLSKMGSPIRGDVKYGFDKPNADNCINLHARRLYFIHPVKKEPIICKAAVPENSFWEEFLELDKEEIKDKNLKMIY